jgi:hypothetical protein
MAKLSKLATAPSVHFMLVTKSQCVALTTSNINYDTMGESAHRSDRVFIKDAPMTKLPIDSSTPSVVT